MKLKLTSIESKETLELEVADSCTIRELKEILCLRLSNGCCSFSVPVDRLFLNLNRKDELSGSSLQSLGVTSGDLIFYSFNPIPVESSSHSVNPQNPIDDLEKLSAENAPGVDSKNSAEKEPLVLNEGCEIRDLVGSFHAAAKENLKFSNSRKWTTVPEALETSGGEVEGIEAIEVDGGDGDDANFRSLPVTSLLKKVFQNEMGSCGSSTESADKMLLNVAVHAVLLKFGFVRYDPVLCTEIGGLHLPDGFPSSPLHYTTRGALSSQGVRSVMVKFENFGNLVNVTGSLAGKFICRECLDVSRFASAFNLVWKNGKSVVDPKSEECSMLKNPESDVFEFWERVKDGIAWPLLNDLRGSVALEPPSFMLLPNDIMLKILELLPGTDIAKVAIVCAELRFISSNNVLWKKKYEECFGTASSNMDTSWKLKFEKAWTNMVLEAETFVERSMESEIYTF